MRSVATLIYRFLYLLAVSVLWLALMVACSDKSSRAELDHVQGLAALISMLLSYLLNAYCTYCAPFFSLLWLAFSDIFSSASRQMAAGVYGGFVVSYHGILCY